MKKLITALLIIIFISCESDDDTTTTQSICGPTSDLVIDGSRYVQQTEEVAIQEISVINDCLNVTISASGCDGDNWTLALVDSGEASNDDIPRRRVILDLDNRENCLAFITRTFTYDLRPLRADGNEIVIEISNAENDVEEINYTY